MQLPVQSSQPQVTHRFSCRRSVVCAALLTLAWLCFGSQHAAAIHDTTASLAPVAVWGDLDGDGRPDDVVIQRHGAMDTVGLLLSASGDSEAPLDVGPGFVALSALDVDGDGDVDLITTTASGAEFWLNDGHGVFTRSDRPASHRLTGIPVTDSGSSNSLVAVCATPSATTVRRVMDPRREPALTVESACVSALSTMSPSASRPRAPPSRSARS
jgi:hypothetical protein